MIRMAALAIGVVLAVGIGGCASWRHEPPSCDGGERRPMNKGKWNEELAGLGGPCGKANRGGGE